MMASALESTLNPSRPSPLDGIRLPFAVALMTAGIGAAAQASEPDSAAQSPEQAAAPAARTASATEVAIEQITLAPNPVWQGGVIEITTEYQVVPPPGTATVAVTESWALLDGGRETLDYHSSPEARTPTHWLAKASLRIPRAASPGRYTIVHRVATTTSQDQRTTDFIVAPRVVPPEVTDWLARGRTALAAKRLLTPEDDAAVTYARRALAADPGNPEAQALLGEVIDTYLGWADAQIGRYSLARASSNLSKAHSLEAYASTEQQGRYETLQRELRAKQSQAAAQRRHATQATNDREEEKGLFGTLKRQLRSADCAIQGLIDPDYCK
ncbi:hypothetical protein [Thiococcus pfennigii]|jgi:hypothetical protein|uniref:hypothetical protein n=1 Tax=Thiococcus pfennigii TaxID=1057 RepID=UPI001904FC99|nr:hypothetical protein [Thiococcus pfennigii]